MELLDEEFGVYQNRETSLTGLGIFMYNLKSC